MCVSGYCTWNFKIGMVGRKIFLFCSKFLYEVNRKKLWPNRETPQKTLKNFRAGGEKLGTVSNLKHTLFYFRPYIGCIAYYMYLNSGCVFPIFLIRLHFAAVFYTLPLF